MKVVILCGGRGTRISEETDKIPKPMVEVGGKPILWHIMKIYSFYGFNEFILCLGYKGYLIKEYFSHYFLHMNDLTIDLANNTTSCHTDSSEQWKVTLVETGLDTMTGGRLKRVEKYLNNERFLLTYGDGISDVNIKELILSHEKHKKLLSLTAVQSVGRFGVLDLDENNQLNSFLEKPKGDNNWINGGFFVVEPEIFNLLNLNDQVIWEQEPLTELTKQKQINTYKHNGFWKGMDTLRDKIELDNLWVSSQAVWKIWD